MSRRGGGTIPNQGGYVYLFAFTTLTPFQDSNTGHNIKRPAFGTKRQRGSQEISLAY